MARRVDGKNREYQRDNPIKRSRCTCRRAALSTFSPPLPPLLPPRFSFFDNVFLMQNA